MSLTKFTENVNNIQSLADKPALTSEQLKAKFDKTGADIKTYLNSTLTSEIDTALGTKANASNTYSKSETYSKTETYNKTEIDSATGAKVSKAGDTLTGYLSFANTNDYPAIIKQRTISDVNYYAKLGIGGDGSVRLERNVGTSGSGTSLEVRSDGLYNGLSNKKLAEQLSSWTSVSPYGSIDGTIKYTRIGNVVFVVISDIEVDQNIVNGSILATDLPKSTDYIVEVLSNFDYPNKPFRIAINQSGNIISHYTTIDPGREGAGLYYGILIYMTNDN